jgi:hypothetical protein
MGDIHRRAIRKGTAAASGFDHHEAHVDPDSYLEIFLSRVGELPDSLYHLEGATNDARRVILMGWVAEIDRYAVA